MVVNKIKDADLKTINKVLEYMENVPRKEMQYKDKIRDVANDLLYDILQVDYGTKY